MLDYLIVGGGLIGRSLAWELCQQGQTVAVVDPGPSRHSASWAAAGILPPPLGRQCHDPIEQLRTISHLAYGDWCDKLTRHSGVNVGFARCGGLYLGRRAGEAAALQAALEQWEHDGIRVESISIETLAAWEPRLALNPPARRIYHLPDEAQVRPNRLLQALTQVLESADIVLPAGVSVVGWKTEAGEIRAVQTTEGTIAARQFCISAGPWTTHLLQQLGIDFPVEPRRGQIAQWKLPTPPLRRVINEGPRYLICRDDGTVLAGSTVEDVGFDPSTTPAGMQALIEFATSLLPELGQLPIASCWAGLRPHTRDGLPYIGRVAGWDNLFVASGHFRSGVHLAPATARLLGQLMRGVETDLDLQPFDPCRS